MSKVLYPILFLIFETLSFSIDLQIQVMDGSSPMAEGHRLDLMNGNLVVDSAYTGASGEAVLSVPQGGSWEVQLTYNGRLHERSYSVGGSGLSTQFVLPEATWVELLAYDGPQNGRMIHALDGSGQEISYTRSTDSSGYTSFHLEPGMYQFRHSWNGRQHYSSITPAGLTTTLQVPQRTLVRILENGMPLQGQVVESHFLDGTKIHYSRMTDHDGYAEFHLEIPEVLYRVRRFGRNTFSSETPSGGSTAIFLQEPTVVSLHVPSGADATTFEVRVFGDGGNSMGYSQYPDSSGVAHFDLPSGNYFFRVQHNGFNHDSSLIASGETTSIFLLPPIQVSLLYDSTPLEGGKIEAYLDGIKFDISQFTDADGKAWFSLPEGNWSFRHSRHGWDHFSSSVSNGESATIALPGDTSVSVTGLPTGVLESVRMNDANGSFLGIAHSVTQTSSALFSTPVTGLRQFRLSYNGTEFFSGETPSGSSTTIVIPAYTSILVVENGVPVADRVVELHASTGEKLGYSRNTDASGWAEFSLEEQNSWLFRARDSSGQVHFSQPVATGLTGVLELSGPSSELSILWLNAEEVSKSFFPYYPLEGELSSPNVAEVRVNGNLAQVHGERFFLDLGLVYGNNTFMVSAKSTEFSSPVTREFTLNYAQYQCPQIVNITPASGSTVSTHWVDVSFDVDGYSANLRLESGGHVISIPGVKSQQVALQVPLTRGNNALYLRSEGYYSCTNRVDLRVNSSALPAFTLNFPDRIPPEINPYIPLEIAPSVYLQKPATVQVFWKSLDMPHLSGSLNSVIAYYPGPLSLGFLGKIQGVPLPEGNFEIEVRATDNAGQTFTVYKNILLAF